MTKENKILVDDNGKIDHEFIDNLLSKQMGTLDDWINSHNVQRWYWTTLRAMALSTAYELISEIEKCGKDNAHAAAYLLKSRIDYASPFVGPKTVGWSYKQLSIATDPIQLSMVQSRVEIPKEKIWIIIGSYSGIPEVSAYFTEEACRNAWNDLIDDDYCREREYMIERYDRHLDRSWTELLTADIAWEEGWCEMHKNEYRWDIIYPEGEQ